MAKVLAFLQRLYKSPEADEAVQKSQSVSDLLIKLAPVVFALVVAGKVGVNSMAGKARR